MLLLAFALLQAGSVDEVIVRASRAENQLSECLARDCSVAEDVRFSIGGAEAHFARGDYRQARRMLQASIRRNRHNASTAPHLVSALYEALSTVQMHAGDIQAYRMAKIASVQALKDNLPADDPRVLLTTIDLADYWLTVGQPREAERQFERAARGFAARGDDNLAMLANLRIVGLDIARRRLGSAVARLAIVRASDVADDLIVRQAVGLMEARLAIASGDEAAVDTLINLLRTGEDQPPVLIQSGPRPDPRGRMRGFEALDLRPDTGIEAQVGNLAWADVGFRIDRDGRVSDVEVLRAAGETGWLAPYLREVSGRSYVPSNAGIQHSGQYRVERYSIRNERQRAPGSLIAGAAGPRTVVVADMTAADVTLPAAGAVEK